MNFKRYHESKNLFNSTPYKEGYALAADGSETENSDFNIYEAFVDSSELTYILSGIAPADRNIRIHEYIDNRWVRQIFALLGSYLPIPFIKSSNTNRFLISIHKNNSDMMLNTGSTALPYEPYSSEVWHDIPHYIHNTSTDTITTLPADIYANDNNATVGLKGQMKQSSTPTPTTPITPSECGDLETEGEHAGQYKIPILSNSTTTPVYLGEVQSSRRIKKLVLTGQENITSGHLDVSLFNVPVSDYLKENINSIVSTHYTSQNNVTVWNYVNDKRVCFYAGAGTNTILYIRDSTFSTVEDFKAYLAQQYAAGTPVTVWYILATPETAVVNEPIRKIGDYADEVSGITIPVTAGTNTLSIDTSLQPSEVTATYKGWHPVQSVHEYDSNYTIATMQSLTIAQLQTHTISELQGGEWS